MTQVINVLKYNIFFFSCSCHTCPTPKIFSAANCTGTFHCHVTASYKLTFKNILNVNKHQNKRCTPNKRTSEENLENENNSRIERVLLKPGTGNEERGTEKRGTRGLGINVPKLFRVWRPITAKIHSSQH